MHAMLPAACADFYILEVLCKRQILSHMQIHTFEQLATAMVHAYPWVVSHLTLEVLAKDRQQPSMQELIDDTSVDDLQHAANWEEVLTYLKTIAMQNLHEYVPVIGRM